MNSPQTAPMIARLLRNHLGVHWPVTATTIVLLIFWPIAVFWNRVSFAPSRFIEEWIKAGVNGLVIFFVLELLRARSSAARELAALSRWLDQHCLVPARSLQLALANILRARPEAGPLPSWLDVQTQWEHLRSSLAALPESASASFGVAENLREAANALEPSRCAAILRGLFPAGALTETLNKEELTELDIRIARLCDTLLQVRSRLD